MQTHRDPVRIVVSLATMIAYGRRTNYRHIDLHALGRSWTSRVKDLLRGSIEGRRSIPHRQVMDVHFTEFMENPFETVERVFGFARQAWRVPVPSSVQRYIDENPRAKHGSVEYRLGALGLEVSSLREQMRFYQEHFEIADEPTDDL